MGSTFSLAQKCRLVTLTGGLTLLIAGVIFFLISLGLPRSVWLTLGGVCLGAGTLTLMLTLCCVMCHIHGMEGNDVPRDKDDTYATNTVDDANITL